ncbi:polyhydroxyalkanoic acid system family protein [Erythrobacteraceae bacterium E2-1 Yellow Sea]|nr:polyhydroxyalkanoic acid system family protein [Erythrobacteraceae bacterium E2-1 Yellow Sea]
MRVALPHNLDRAEVRRRLSENSHKIAGHIPGGIADITADWKGDDLMQLDITAMGQTLAGQIEVEDDQVVINLDVPMALSFFKSAIESAVRSNGPKLLK